MGTEIPADAREVSRSEAREPAWRNLIPELLLALLGCSGGAFVYVERTTSSCDDMRDGVSPEYGWKDLEAKKLVLSEVVDWVSEAEREQLTRIAGLGWYYDWLYGYAIEMTTTSGVRSVLSADKARQRKSPYQVAVAQGCLELLDVYRQAVLKIEERLVDSGVDVNKSLWSLLPLEQALSEFAELFPFLYHSIRRMLRGSGNSSNSSNSSSYRSSSSSSNMTSREIIEMFETAARSGIPVVEVCSLRIAWHCYQVLFKQMHAWMVHGRLVDPAGDFFIHVEQREPSTRALVSRYIDADVIASRLPAAISVPFAKDVLYVGQCTRILDSLRDNASTSLTDNDRSDPNDDTFEDGLKKIWTSPPEGLDWISLKNLVNAQKIVLSDRVWTEMHHAGRNLAGHVDDFVDVVLQNRGSLYAELAEAVASIASEAPVPERAAALASHVFRIAAYQDSYGDGSYGKYGYIEEGGTAATMTWYDTGNAECIAPIWHPKYDHSIWIPSYDAWDGLCIRYTLKWPMHLVFSVKAMRVYGGLWQLMFRMTRALHDMKAARVLMRKQKHGRSTLALHHRLYHFLVTYAMYIQEEIVTGSKDKIHSILTSSTSLIQAEAKHMEFIADIVQTSCIDVKQIMGVLENMFVCVKSLVSVVHAYDCDGSDMDIGPLAREIDAVRELFLSKYNVWYQLLQSNTLQGGKRGEAIRRLLLRMNFNGFMDANAARQVDQHQLHLAD